MIDNKYLQMDRNPIHNIIITLSIIYFVPVGIKFLVVKGFKCNLAMSQDQTQRSLVSYVLNYHYDLATIQIF